MWGCMGVGRERLGLRNIVVTPMNLYRSYRYSRTPPEKVGSLGPHGNPGDEGQRDRACRQDASLPNIQVVQKPQGASST